MNFINSCERIAADRRADMVRERSRDRRVAVAKSEREADRVVVRTSQRSHGLAAGMGTFTRWLLARARGEVT